MRIEKTAVKRQALYFLLSTAIYFVLLVPFKQIQLLPGFADFRISAIFPVLAGLLMGPAGAVGCGVGNLLADLFGMMSMASLYGAVGNFLFAFLPYKLWHTLIPLENHRIGYLSSANSLLKYLGLTAFSVVTSMSVIGAGGELLGLFTFSRFLRTTVLCNLCFSVFFGTVIFLLLTEYFGVRPYVPQKVYQYAYAHKKYVLDYILCVCILVLEFCAYLFSARDYGAGWLDGLCCALLTGIGVLMLLPMVRSREKVTMEPVRYTAKKGLKSQLLIGFLLFASIEILIFCLAMYLLISGNYPQDVNNTYFSDMWLQIFEHSVIGGGFFLLALYIVLRWAEKRVIKPIEEIAGYSERFVAEKLESEKPPIPALHNEIQTLGESVVKMSDDMIRYVKTIQEQTKNEERNRAVLSVARNIQMGILPKPWTDKTPWQTAAYIHPAQEVGGDFYDFFPVSEDRFLVCIADVSGKGVTAAMFMAEASMLVKAFKEQPPGEMLGTINNILCDNNSEDLFVTMFLGVLDVKKKVFEFANAGHNFPLWSDGETCAWLETEPDLVLGMMPDTGYTLHTIPADGFFELLLYTDGVNEAENEKREFFGTNRLLHAFSALGRKEDPLQTQLESLCRRIKGFTGPAPQSDDITMLLLRYEEGDHPPVI